MIICSPADHNHQNFPGDHASVTFVGRPFPLSEAHEHFARLRRWGLTFSEFSHTNVNHETSIDNFQVRFLVTWEAVEHAGP